MTRKGKNVSEDEIKMKNHDEKRLKTLSLGTICLFQSQFVLFMVLKEKSLPFHELTLSQRPWGMVKRGEILP